MKATDRVVWVDIAKGIGILAVTAGHTQLVQKDVLWSLIYAFHMPLFFIVAGFCYNENRYSSWFEYFKRKSQALLWPYFMLTVAVALLTLLLGINFSISSFSILYNPYPGARIIGFWFVRVLFFAELIFAAFKSDKAKIGAAGVALLLGLMISTHLSTGGGVG